ncbi:M23 family metallopeptidase [Pseudonocardia sp. N23]|uniref:M23 family metallopeptidase n=1 Tax=Pseudonocardia sp. N23 TaxID=1987376 RepID=UPI000BFD5892|nr:M23 family metallopeptidase [Pseudonocardia sp. N23]GAY12599.1 phage peptidoglycan binding endopeptidase [Pseudonocardia sp. N23]
MFRHNVRAMPLRHLGSLTLGALAVAFPVLAPHSDADDSPAPDTRWAPVAQVGTEERHDPAPRVNPVRAERHDRVALASLDKATRLAETIASYAALRDAATAQGAPDAAVTRGGQVFALPTTGRLTSAAGPRWGTTHYGLDIANKVGTPVFAVGSGTVIDSGPASGFGLWVRIRHADGSVSLYGHIDRSLVRVGQSVRAGDRIALMGNRGQSTGPHLHLEIWSADGRKLDPATWLSRRGLDVG